MTTPKAPDGHSALPDIPLPWRMGDICTNPEEGVPGEIALIADANTPTGTICPVVVLPFGDHSMGRAFALKVAEFVLESVNAAPTLLAERDALAARVAELEAHLGTALQYWSGHFTSRFDELLGQDRSLEGNEFRESRAALQEPKP